MHKVIVVGGGAAGMMAAIQSAKKGNQVLLFEKNERLGKKLFITGKGRCNVTNGCDVEELFGKVVSNHRFLYSSFYSFTNQDAIDFFEELGVPLKRERGDRIFPVSDHSSDIIRALEKEMDRLGVDVRLNTEVKSLKIEQKDFIETDQDGKKAKKDTCTITGVVLSNGRTEKADAVIVTTGGLSYPSTGSTGDGFKWAKDAGHKVTELSPSLVPVHIKEDWCQQMMGLSLRNTGFKAIVGKKKIYEEQGELLFTHFGISGPVVLSFSAYAKKYLDKGITVILDLKPAMSKEQLDARILRDFADKINKQFKNSLDDLLPKKMIPIIIERSAISPEKKVNEITKEERTRLVTLLKEFDLTVTGLGNFKEAIITKGGIAVKEVDPGTMESKLVSGLYFAGEILDLDALTGGYNLQIAWSTAYLAGQNA
ncbi:MAG: NAD(P)/FAD-dependent oxidoreductase [Lachnospiraceae bacterium]|nr:NAD(P)/FAD-dependent oxidoreductase [Lachnospiraceae bacterium]